MNNRLNNKIFYIVLGTVLAGSIFLASCSKTLNESSKPLYPASPVLTVTFLSSQPSPTTASAGDEVSFSVTGLDSLPGYTFYINQSPATIVSQTDSLITVKVPENASTGPASVVSTDGKYFYGPVLTINGKVNVDATFKMGSGTNGEITSVISTTAVSGPQQNFILGGLFTNYNAQATTSTPINNIVMITSSGTYQNPSSTSVSNPGLGVSGSISTMLKTPDNQYLIGGAFSKYNDIGGLFGITQLNSDISIDTTVVDLVNPDPDHYPQNSQDTVATFNAGFTNGRGSVVKVFNDYNTGGYDVLGNFGMYVSYYYLRSEKSTLILTPTVMNSFARLNNDGSLDSTYNFDPSTGKSYSGLNGAIIDAVQLSSGQIVVVGSFTTFNGQSAPGIAALADDGSLDQGFASAVGSGADGNITKITYNATLHKILITGTFKHFNGVATAGIAMLNEDGSMDNTLQLRQFGNGSPNFAGQLNNGQIIISGTFSTYDGIVRQGFMVLNEDGSLAQGYNNTGSFNGWIDGMIEDVNGSGQRTVLLYGSFNLFNNSKAGNILRLVLD